MTVSIVEQRQPEQFVVSSDTLTRSPPPQAQSGEGATDCSVKLKLSGHDFVEILAMLSLSGENKVYLRAPARLKSFWHIYWIAKALRNRRFSARKSIEPYLAASEQLLKLWWSHVG